MKRSPSWLFLSLVYCLTTHAVTPQGTAIGEAKGLSVLTNSYKEIFQSPCKTLIAVSDHETIIKTNDTLYLLKDAGEKDAIVLGESRLHGQPTDIQAVLFGETIYVTVNYDREVHLYKYRRNASHRGLHRVKYRQPDYYAYPPTSNVTVSIHVRDNSTYLYIYMVYISETAIIAYDIHNTRHRDITLLPPHCYCRHGSQCLSSTHNYQGQVIVKCEDDKRYLSYLFNIFEDELFSIPQPIHHFIATSSYNRKSVVAIMHFEDTNQDLLLVLNCSYDKCLVRAAIPHHEEILDIAITRVYNSAAEIIYILGRDNVMQYFMLQEDGTTSSMAMLSVPPNINISRFGGVSMNLSSLAIVVTLQNRTFLTQARAVLLDQVIEEDITTPGIQPTQTAIISNETNSIQSTRMSANQTILITQNKTRSIVSTADITPTALPAQNTTVPVNDTRTFPEREKHKGSEITIVVVVTAVVVIILLIILSWKKYKQHRYK